MYTTIRHDLRHAKKAWPGTQIDPCLLSEADLCLLEYTQKTATEGIVVATAYK
jgi:hypothetical protein